MTFRDIQIGRSAPRKVTFTDKTNVASHFLSLKHPFKVLDHLLFLSTLQLDAIVQQCRFWTGQPMIDIFRPTQPLDGRIVYQSKASAAPMGAIHLWLGVLSAVLSVGLTH